MNKPALADEARHLYSCLFREPLDAQFVARYEAAHRQVFPDERTSPLMAAVVGNHLDVEAIELALRRRGTGRELTRKLQIVCYLAEARRACFDEFITTGGSPLRAWFALAVAACQSGWKLVKGEYLIYRYNLP
jgi:hypothetical protein